MDKLQTENLNINTRIFVPQNAFQNAACKMSTIMCKHECDKVCAMYIMPDHPCGSIPSSVYPPQCLYLAHKEIGCLFTMQYHIFCVYKSSFLLTNSIGDEIESIAKPSALYLIAKKREMTWKTMLLKTENIDIDIISILIQQLWYKFMHGSVQNGWNFFFTKPTDSVSGYPKVLIQFFFAKSSNHI